MGQSTVISPTKLEQFNRLADLLERASKLSRELGQSGKKAIKRRIPELNSPKHIPKDQEWFWTREWRQMEHEVDEGLVRGDYRDFNSIEALFAYLDLQV